MNPQSAGKSAARALFGLFRSTQSVAFGSANAVSTFAAEFKTEWQRLSESDSAASASEVAEQPLPKGARREFGLTILPG